MKLDKGKEILNFIFKIFTLLTIFFIFHYTLMFSLHRLLYSVDESSKSSSVLRYVLEISFYAIFLYSLIVFVVHIIKKWRLENNNNQFVFCKNDKCEKIMRRHQAVEKINKYTDKPYHLCKICGYEVETIKKSRKVAWLKNNPDFPKQYMMEEFIKWITNYLNLDLKIREIEKKSHQLFEYKMFAKYYGIDKNIPEENKEMLSKTKAMEEKLTNELNDLINNCNKYQKQRLNEVKEKLMEMKF